MPNNLVDCPRCQHRISPDQKLSVCSSSSESLTALTMQKLSTMVRSSISKVVKTHRKSSKHLSTSTPSLSSSTATSARASSSRLISSSATPLSSSSSSSPSISSHTSRLWLFSMWLLLFVVVVAGQGQEVAGEEKEIAAFADHYLSTFGYYRHGRKHHPAGIDTTSLSDAFSTVIPTTTKSTEGSVETHTEEERRQAVERLQAFFHMPVTGHLDKKTKEIMAAPRCGREDFDDDADEEENADEKEAVGGGKIRKKRYSINKNRDGTPAKWTQSQLTWRITEPSQQIPVSQQRMIMSKALDVWARVVPIKFVEIGGNEIPDIDIRFARGRHGSEYDPVFDGAPTGRENVLAHAWGPGVRVKDLPGDAHFDDGDDWSNADTLLGVAVHELGHVMGLGHSDDDKAIMFPAYRDVTALGEDDLAGIYALYGSNGRPQIRRITSRPEQPRYTVRPDRRTFTNRPTSRPDPRQQTNRPDPRYRTVRPDPRYRTVRPDPRYRTDRPDRRYRTERPTARPDPRSRTERPDRRYWTERPDPRYRTVRPDPRYRTDRPDPRYRTERPDRRYWTERPDPRYRTVRPDPRYRTDRPDPRYRTERPDGRYWTERPEPRTRGPYYTVRPEWVTPGPTVTTTINQCASITVDAVFEDPDARLRRVFYAISGGHVHQLTTDGKVFKSRPLKDVFPELPGKPDAAFSVREHQAVYFIKDSQLWAYQGEQLVTGFPRSLGRHNFPENPRFAVTMPNGRGNTRILLFGKRYWWQYDLERSTTVRYNPISDFSSSFPTDVVFASYWTDNKLYAVSKDSYIIMDMDRREVTHKEPLLGKPEWLHQLCDSGSRSSAAASMTLIIGLLAVVNLVKSFLMN